jgi:hypothetical protein
MSNAKYDSLTPSQQRVIQQWNTVAAEYDAIMFKMEAAHTRCLEAERINIKATAAGMPTRAVRHLWGNYNDARLLWEQRFDERAVAQIVFVGIFGLFPHEPAAAVRRAVGGV